MLTYFCEKKKLVFSMGLYIEIRKVTIIRDQLNHSAQKAGGQL